MMISQIFVRSDEIPELDLPDDRSIASSTPKATNKDICFKECHESYWDVHGT